MAVDYGIRIQIDAAVTDDQKAKISAEIMRVLRAHNISVLAYNASYSAGSATDQIEVTIDSF